MGDMPSLVDTRSGFYTARGTNDVAVLVRLVYLGKTMRTHSWKNVRAMTDWRSWRPAVTTAGE